MKKWAAIGRIKKVGNGLKTAWKQRLYALFLFITLLTGVVIPPVSAYAATQQMGVNPHNQGKDTVQHGSGTGKQLSALGDQVPAQYAPAADAPPTGQGAAANALVQSGKKAAQNTDDTTFMSPEAMKAKAKNAKGSPVEVTAKRTATSETFQNADGSFTLKQYAKPKYFKGTDGKLKTIDTSLKQDTVSAASDLTNLVTPKLQSAKQTTSDNFLKVTGNDWQAYFAPTGNSTHDPVIIEKDGKKVSIAPVNGAISAPTVTSDPNGRQTITYKNVWKGIDLAYQVKSDELKEYIMVKDKTALTSYAFKITGASLVADPEVPGGFRLKGNLEQDFSVAPLVVSTWDTGPVSETVATQNFKNGTLTVNLDSKWLQGLQKSNFPVAIDPSFNTNFGTRASGNYQSFKSDGYNCTNSVVCLFQAGGLYQSGWKYWHGMFYAPYSQLQGHNLLSANLHMQMLPQSAAQSSVGWTDNRTMYVSWANCFGYNCYQNSSTVTSGTMGSVGDINVTNTMAWLKNNNVWDGWMMIWMEEGQYNSYKVFDPDYSYLTVNYNSPPYMTTPMAPGNGGTSVTTQPSLHATPVGDPEGQQVKYYFRISSNPDAETGSIANSGWLDVPQWTVPEGVLQDGVTYYWHAYTSDNYETTAPNWVWSFKVDLRKGKNATQAYDTAGPVAIDMATGNLTTGIATHSMKALGGSIGVELEYNSPTMSRNGLVGEYFPTTNQTGAAYLKRVDPAIDFDWDTGAPSSGLPNDGFSARWTGYFVVPETGSYQFGGTNDDSETVTLNGQVVYNNGGCWPANCYGGTISLTAGQVLPITITYADVTGYAYTHLKMLKNGVETTIASDWLKTGALPTETPHGLTGYYYYDNGSHTFPTSQNGAFLVRNDPQVSFYWDLGGPVPSGPADNFMTRWTGYLTVPTTGDYQFGTNSDDGSRIYVGNTGTPAFEKWQVSASGDVWGTTNVSLTAGVAVPITVEYFEQGGGATMDLKIKGAVAAQSIPAAWLTPKADVLPAGWQLSMSADGSLSYDRLRVSSNSVILTDSSGTTHEYIASGTGYKPPVNEDGHLVRNDDGSYTLQDVDGRTYVFGTNGTLQATSVPLDDKTPAALQYSYSASPAKLTKITDGVTNTRYGQLFYAPDTTNCPGSAPSGFDGVAPAGMICAYKTSDGQVTKLWYKTGLLSRIELPGGAIQDYLYDTLGRIVKVRETAAADAVAAGIRTDDDTVTTQLAYDALGRAVTATMPAPTAGASRPQQTLQYLTSGSGYYGATQLHVSGQSEPSGFSKRLEYDNLLRSTKITDLANQSTTTTWDPIKDLVTSTTDNLGRRTVTQYDSGDRATGVYGPAPASWFNADGSLSASADATQIPRVATAYDENMPGLEATYYNYGSGSKSFLMTPRLHTQGIGASNGDVLKTWGAATPVKDQNNNFIPWGVRLTGQITLAQAGTYSFRALSDDGVRLWIDDQTVIDNWADGAQRSRTGTFVAQAGKTYRIQMDYYDVGGNDAKLELYTTPPSGGETSALGSLLKPRYNLATTSTSYDSTVGNMVTKTNYGSTPQLGLAQSATSDPTGLNLTSSSTYETPGSGFNRVTSKTLPGNTTTNYAYWGANETADNPCTTGVTEAYHQAGLMRYKTDSDPDGAGSQTPVKSETIYDEVGRIAASRYNQESWTCNTYDARGRLTQTVVPAFNSEAARTITKNYAVNGNPLAMSVGDAQGDVVTTYDLLGRVAAYRDVYWDTTNYVYDNAGNLIQKVGPVNNEVYTYDTFNRLVTQSLDGTVYAHVYYDTYGRVDHIDYPAAGGLGLSSASHDVLGRLTGYTWHLNDGTNVSDTVTRSQSGLVLSDVVASGSNSLWYTYGYDHADRLTSANIGPHSYAYGYGAQSATCAAGTNPNSGKNSNRTSQTIDGVTTTYCYDYADRLVSSSDPTANYAEYDAHGNMTYLGTGTTPLRMCYDSSDRNWCLVSYDAANTGDGLGMYYNRDVTGRIMSRFKDNISAWTWTETGAWWYNFSGSGDAPAYARDSSWNVVERYITLPGGVQMTVRDQEPQANNKKVYSLPNVHGDVLLTVNAAGNNISTGNGPASSFTYDPFGNKLAGSTLPANITNVGSYGWAGSNSKLTENGLALAPIQMGSRVYLPTLGRFTQRDPVEGGTPNNYVYVLDPINANDYSGLFGWHTLAGIGLLIVGTAAAAAAPLTGPFAPLVYVGVAGIYAGAAYELTGSQSAAQSTFTGFSLMGGGMSLQGSTGTAPARGGSGSSSASRGAAADSLQGGRSAPARVDSTPVRAQDILNRIDNSTFPSGLKGGGVWANDGRGGTQVLPRTTGSGQGITYKEWDVNAAGDAGRDAQRIITGSDGSAWYTSDHYYTFVRMR